MIDKNMYGTTPFIGLKSLGPPAEKEKNVFDSLNTQKKAEKIDILDR